MNKWNIDEKKVFYYSFWYLAYYTRLYFVLENICRLTDFSFFQCFDILIAILSTV